MVALASSSRSALAEDSLPTASSVLQRVLLHAEQTSRSDGSSKYAYEKKSVVEELDSEGKATKTTEKIYHVMPIEGIPFSRLIRIQDRDLTREELKEQDKKEKEFRDKIAARNPKLASERDDDALNARLVERYDFKVERRGSLDNRPVLVVSFRPKKPHQPEKTIEDKVLNRLAGSVWIDEPDAEVVQVQVRLLEDLSLGWLGMIGSIRQCDVTIERQRLPEGLWVNKTFAVSLGGRKVIGSMRYRTSDQCYDFRKP